MASSFGFVHCKVGSMADCIKVNGYQSKRILVRISYGHKRDAIWAHRAKGHIHQDVFDLTNSSNGHHRHGVNELWHLIAVNGSSVV